MAAPHLIWDRGTAYDLFISLMVIHEPAEFNLRPAWAAGMRSRLPAADREFLEMLQKAHYLKPPLNWLYTLSEPKDGMVVLQTLEQIPPGERLTTLFSDAEKQESHQAEFDILYDVAQRGAWNADDQSRLEEAVTYCCREEGESPASRLKAVSAQLELWAQVAETGDRLLRAIRSYYEVFFIEEERRIGPALDQAIANAQELAKQMAPAELLEELSQGIKFGDEVLDVDELILAPTYWCSPLVFYNPPEPNSMLVTFGARAPTDSLVPGEAVPDALVVMLKALSDPTRLRILRYLGEEAQTPTQLARSLRLRPPTVIHHLTKLRMAGLVQVDVTEGKEKTYSARSKTVDAAMETLKDFLGPDDI